MAGGGGSGNSTTTINPPKYQQPYIQAGLGSAQDLYNTQAQNPGASVAPFSGDTNAAFGNIRQLAGGASGITQNANGLANQTLNGDFLNSNPYIDATFQKAALGTQNQLASEFGRSGRNVDQSQGNRAQQLNDLATQIYGGNYANERANQQQTLGMSGQLDQANYTGANALLGIGSQQENLNQQQIDASGKNLDDYMQRVSGSYGQTSSAPSNTNRGAGILGGAMAGSQLGSQYGYGGYGAVLGGLLGGYG